MHDLRRVHPQKPATPSELVRLRLLGEREEIKLLARCWVRAPSSTGPGQALDNRERNSRPAMQNRPNDLAAIAGVVDVGSIGAGPEDLLRQWFIPREQAKGLQEAGETEGCGLR